MSKANIVTEIIPHEISTHGKFINISEKIFGKLSVICYAGVHKWYCQCECGNIIIANSGHLRNGNTKSCGCYHNERMAEIFTIFQKSVFVNGIMFTIGAINAQLLCLLVKCVLIKIVYLR